MKKIVPNALEDCRVSQGLMSSTPAIGMLGMFVVPVRRVPLLVMSGIGMGWDHVSVSTGERPPTWDEMNFIKDLFFEEEELVVQFHPPKSKYINKNPNVLHLWRPWNQEIKLPPKEMV